VCAVFTTVIYFYHFDFSQRNTYSDSSYAFLHPLSGLHFFSFAVGDALGGQIHMFGFFVILTPSPNLSDAIVTCIGIVLAAIALWIAVSLARRRTQRAYAVGVALICYGLLFAATVTVGRIAPGLPIRLEAGAGRFTTFTLLIVVGSYLALIDRPERQRWSAAQTVRRTALFVVLAALGLQIVLGTWGGVTQARAWHAAEPTMANVTVNVSHASDDAVFYLLSFPGWTVPTVRKLAVIARHDRLALFGTSLASQYESKGLPARLRR
jgi:hypothetical protein